MNLKTIHYSSVKHIQILFQYDYMFRSKNHYQAKIIKLRKKYNSVIVFVIWDPK